MSRSICDKFVHRTGKVNFFFPQYYKSDLIAKPPLQFYYCIRMFHCGYIYTVSGTASISVNYIYPFPSFYFVTLVLNVDKTLTCVKVLNFKIPKNTCSPVLEIPISYPYPNSTSSTQLNSINPLIFLK